MHGSSSSSTPQVYARNALNPHVVWSLPAATQAGYAAGTPFLSSSSNGGVGLSFEMEQPAQVKPLSQGQWTGRAQDQAGVRRISSRSIARESSGLMEPPSRTKKMVESDRFQLIVGCVIMANVLSMALETDHGEWVNTWEIVNNIFCGFFVFEITSRMLAYGRKFWVPADCWGQGRGDCFWNYFDFSIAVLCVLDLWVKNLIIHLFKIDQSDKHQNNVTKTLMILRMLRILRIIRVARIFHFSPQLMMLVRGIIESVQLVVWIAVLLFTVMLVFSIFLTETVGNNADQFENPELIRKYWGGILHCMVTLFQFITLDDWSAISREVVNHIWWMQLVFDAYIFGAAFAILSLLTAVVADHMSEVSDAEKVEEDRQKDKALEDLMQELEQQHDIDTITPEAFKEFIRRNQVREQLEKAGVEIKPSEEDILYDFMDKKGAGSMEWEDFKNGIVRMRGDDDVSSQDFLSLRVSADRLVRVLSLDRDKLDETDSMMQEVEKEIEDIRSIIEGFMDFVDSSRDE